MPKLSSDKPVCKAPECKGKVTFPTHNGLCPTCYQNALRLIAGGKTTWQELAEMELCILSGTTTNPLLDAFRKKKEGQ